MKSLSKKTKYVYMFFLLFGPKIASFIDTSVIANILIILYLCGNKIYFNSQIKNMIFYLFSITIYSLIIGIFNLHFDVVFIGRMIRAIFSILGVSIFITKTKNIDFEEMQNILINILLIHAIFIIFSAIIDINIQEDFRWFTGYNKTVRLYRSTGLMAGFDMAGLLCNIGIVLILIVDKFKVNKYVTFMIAIVFTSRFSLILFIIIVITYFIKNFKHEIKVKKITLMITIILISIFAIMLFSLTTNILENANFGSELSKIQNFAKNVQVAYAQTDAISTLEEQLVVPSNPFDLMFGNGKYSGGDPGYTRFINCIGVFGLAFVIFWHIILFQKAYSQYINVSSLVKKRNYILMIFSLILILLNFKNSYFFTGTYFEIMIIEIFIWQRCYIDYKRIYKK